MPRITRNGPPAAISSHSTSIADGGPPYSRSSRLSATADLRFTVRLLSGDWRLFNTRDSLVEWREKHSILCQLRDGIWFLGPCLPASTHCLRRASVTANGEPVLAIPGEGKEITPRGAAEWLVQYGYELPAELQTFEREILIARSHVPASAAGGTNAAIGKSRRRKRSTAKGEAQAKIIAAFTLHHKYQRGSCLNQEPIALRQLAEQANVSPDSAHRFFNSQFGAGDGKQKKDGYKNYRVVCRDMGMP